MSIPTAIAVSVAYAANGLKSVVADFLSNQNIKYAEEQRAGNNVGAYGQLTR